MPATRWLATFDGSEYEINSANDSYNVFLNILALLRLGFKVRQKCQSWRLTEDMVWWILHNLREQQHIENPTRKERILGILMERLLMEPEIIRLIEVNAMQHPSWLLLRSSHD